MNSASDTFIKWLMILLFAPILLGCLTQFAAMLFWMLLPWLIAAGVVVGIAAGLTARLMLRRRLPPGNAAPVLAIQGVRIRRPRGQCPED